MPGSKPEGNVPKAPNMDDFVMVPTTTELKLAQKRQDQKQYWDDHEKQTQKEINRKTNELNQQHKQQEKEKPMVTGQVPYFWKHLDNKNHKNAENELDTRNNVLNEKERLNEDEISEKAHIVYQRSQNFNELFSNLETGKSDNEDSNIEQARKKAKIDLETIMDDANVKQLFSLINDINDTAKLILVNNTKQNKRLLIRRVIKLRSWCNENSSSIQLTKDVCKFFKEVNSQFVDNNDNPNMEFMKRENKENKEFLIFMFTPYFAFYNRFSPTSTSQNKVKELLQMTQDEFDMEMEDFKKKVDSVEVPKGFKKKKGGSKKVNKTRKRKRYTKKRKHIKIKRTKRQKRIKKRHTRRRRK
jgi:hypothetical protein